MKALNPDLSVVTRCLEINLKMQPYFEDNDQRQKRCVGTTRCREDKKEKHYNPQTQAGVH